MVTRMHVGCEFFLILTTNIISLQVYLSKEGTVAAYGMLAKEDIEEGHVLFSIPRCALLHPGTSKIKKVLEEGKALY